jgi:5'-nucleotidase (lipoprotein e(P4) family)
MSIIARLSSLIHPALLACALVALAAAPGLAHAQSGAPRNTTGPSGEGANNLLIAAVAWKQTAAEYRALYYQGYALARLQVERALAARGASDKPLAVISDLDDTVLLPLAYWARLIERNGDFLDDAAWDAWIPTNQMIVAPGAREFLTFCQSRGVEVFYITNRDQGERTFEFAIAHLRTAGLPFADADHLTVLRETSNKQTRQDEIAKTHDIAVLLGDNLNDFRRKYYANNVDERFSLMDEDRAQFGARYILFPNPTDGHWMRAIFGESEPRPSDENRRRFKEAATTVRSGRR